MEIRVTGQKSEIGSINLIAFDIKDAVPTRAIIFKRDVSAQLHQLFL